MQHKKTVPTDFHFNYPISFSLIIAFFTWKLDSRSDITICTWPFSKIKIVMKDWLHDLMSIIAPPTIYFPSLHGKELSNKNVVFRDGPVNQQIKSVYVSSNDKGWRSTFHLIIIIIVCFFFFLLFVFLVRTGKTWKEFLSIFNILWNSFQVFPVF